MPSVTIKGLAEINLSSGSGLIAFMPQWTAKDTQGDWGTAQFFCHFPTAFPAVYDKRAKLPSHN
jgi:hypothetical protein